MGAREWLLLLLLSLLWGGAFFLTEVALLELPPFTVVLGRVGIAAVALLALAGLSGGLPRAPGLWGAFLVMGALNTAVPFSLIASGQVEIDGGLAAILNATTPLFSLVLAHLLTREERLTAGRVAGLLLGVCGVAVLIGPAALAGLERHGPGQIAGLGQIAVLGAAFCYGCAAIYGRRFRGLPLLTVAAGQVTCAALLILPLALVVDRPWGLRPGAATWGALLGLSLFGTALAYLVYFRILARAGATNLLLVTLLIPVSALLLGMLFLGERPGAEAFLGMALIALALAAIDGRALAGLRRKGGARRLGGLHPPS
jgi:drug/metabolite transporter (DMT)-like permease